MSLPRVGGFDVFFIPPGNWNLVVLAESLTDDKDILLTRHDGKRIPRKLSGAHAGSCVYFSFLLANPLERGTE